MARAVRIPSTSAATTSTTAAASHGRGSRTASRAARARSANRPPWRREALSVGGAGRCSDGWLTPLWSRNVTGPGTAGAARRLVVLVSGGGSNLQALLDACADPAYGAQVVAVGADRTGTGGVERARGAGRADLRGRRRRPPLADGVGRGADGARRRVRTGPGRVGRVPAPGRAGLPRGVRRSLPQHPQRAAAVVPRHPRPARCAGLWREGHRRNAVPGRRGRRHRVPSWRRSPCRFWTTTPRRA